MKLTHVLGRTWAIEGAELMGLYMLEEGRCILIDSGRIEEREGLGRLLADEGMIPVGVMSTHIHLDHSINNGWLRRTYGCLAAAPAAELSICRSAATLKSYIYCCSPGTLENKLGEMVSPVDCPIPDEEGVFPFCGVDFRILPTPGHSPGHLCVITPDDVCCVGDALISAHVLQASKMPFMLDVNQSILSMEVLRETHCPFSVVAHKEVLPGQELPALVDANVDKELQIYDLLLRQMDSPMEVDELAAQLLRSADVINPSSIRADVLLQTARARVMGLVEAGELRMEGGVVRRV